MKILIVDDDPQILKLMKKLLGSRGHVVETHEGPFGASAAALRAAPDVVLLDCLMPGLDGPTLSRILRHIPLPRTPRLVLWSSADDATLRQIAADSRLPTLSKRTQLDSLVRALEATSV